ncbi:hypothetical protein CAEBREN_22072 [Caenorhabditis brenneri]|uniref:Uncharacterized protein n=1 Tax=Caenorhabditis brenneri TaxID=135651 RepID=G0P447_CAEBE|nr:hypothetical protein CAEBREN_22072 [Caenorhabditis brenneri]
MPSPSTTLIVGTLLSCSFIISVIFVCQPGILPKFLGKELKVEPSEGIRSETDGLTTFNGNHPSSTLIVTVATIIVCAVVLFFSGLCFFICVELTHKDDGLDGYEEVPKEKFPLEKLARKV